MFRPAATPRGPAWLLPVLVPLLPLLTLAVLRHPRVIYTSDSTAQQSIVRTWLDVGHGVTTVPPDTWALKVPLYLVLENLPMGPREKLLAAVLVLNAVTFVLLGWAVTVLARVHGLRARWYELAVPLAWLATLAGGIGSNRMLPNYRNIELGLCFAVLAVTALALRRPPAQDASSAGDDDEPGDGGTAASRPATGPAARVATLGTASLLLALLWFDDPYIGLLVVAPLGAAALVWFLLFGRDDGVPGRDRRLLTVVAVVLGAVVLTSLVRRIADAAGVRIAADQHSLAMSGTDLANHLDLLRPALEVLVGLDRWPGDTPADTLAQALTLLAVLVLPVASFALAWRGWRRREFVLVLIGLHWPLVVAGFMVSWHTRDVSANRYLILAVYDVAVAAALLLPTLRRRRPAVATGLLVLLGAGAVLNLGTSASAAIDTAGRPSIGREHQAQVVAAIHRAVREHGAVKGYAPFWSANVHSYLAGESTTVSEIVCRGGRLGSREWLSDTARLTRPARTVFVLWDPTQAPMRGCSPEIRDAQFGRPIARYPITPTPAPVPSGGLYEVLVYDHDIAATLSAP